MSEAVLERETPKGVLKAVFNPEKGMNLTSFSLNGVEVIDQSTKNLFEERFAGLGALIGPHFHRRKNPPKVDLPPSFKRLSKGKKIEEEEVFSHGIARYVPWETQVSKEIIDAKLSGKSEVEGVPIAKFEGQGFQMRYLGRLTDEGLSIKLSIVSDSDSLVGLHYYYRLPEGKGTIKTQAAPRFRKTHDEVADLPQDWVQGEGNRIELNLESQEADFGFHPYPSPFGNEIILETNEYTLTTQYSCASEENSFQIYRPKGADFVCIEPLSSSNPKKPQLTVSSIEVLLGIDVKNGK